MDSYIIPSEHRNPLVNMTLDYVTRTVLELHRRGFEIQRSWLDPSAPRDATILFSYCGGCQALVWDEETGWRHGGFIAGRQGIRTVVDQPIFLGGGAVPTPAEMAGRLISGVRVPRPRGLLQNPPHEAV